MMKIGLFYGSSTCYTEIAAEKIQSQLQGHQVDLHNMLDVEIEVFDDYQLLILGIPTWDYGELQEDWENRWDELEQVNWNGKVVALYGMGDQEGYPEWFLDAMGFLYDRVTSLGAKAVGLWPVDGYQFEKSQALTDDQQHFVGLALDEENEFDLTEQRIQAWCQQIVQEFEQAIS